MILDGIARAIEVGDLASARASLAEVDLRGADAATKTRARRLEAELGRREERARRCARFEERPKVLRIVEARHAGHPIAALALADEAAEHHRWGRVLEYVNFMAVDGGVYCVDVYTVSSHGRTRARPECVDVGAGCRS